MTSNVPRHRNHNHTRRYKLRSTLFIGMFGFLLSILGCGRHVNDVAPMLPECSDACVVQPRDNPLLEVGQETFRVWGSKGGTPKMLVESNDSGTVLAEMQTQANALVKSGLPIPTTGYLLCHQNVPGERFAQILHQSKGWKAVALAGRKKSDIGFLALGISRRDTPPAPGVRVEPLKRSPDGSLEKTLDGVSECTGRTCALLTLDAKNYACGEIVQIANELSKRGRFVKIAL